MSMDVWTWSATLPKTNKNLQNPSALIDSLLTVFNENSKNLDPRCPVVDLNNPPNQSLVKETLKKKKKKVKRQGKARQGKERKGKEMKRQKKNGSGKKQKTHHGPELSQLPSF